LVADLAPVFDALLGLRSAVTVTAKLESENIAPVRIMFAMVSDQSGKWRSRNLPLVAPDDAYCASQRISTYEDSRVKMSENFIRALVLGHRGVLQAHRAHLTEHLWIQKEMLSLDQLLERIRDGKLIPASTETGFLGAQLHAYSYLKQVASRAAQDAFEREAAVYQKQSLHELAPEIVVSKTGEFDPRSVQIKQPSDIALVLFRYQDHEKDLKTHKIAGIFL